MPDLPSLRKPMIGLFVQLGPLLAGLIVWYGTKLRYRIFLRKSTVRNYVIFSLPFLCLHRIAKLPHTNLFPIEQNEKSLSVIGAIKF